MVHILEKHGAKIVLCQSGTQLSKKKKKIGTYVLSKFVILLHKFPLVPDVEAVLDSVFVYPEISINLVFLFHVYAYAVIKWSKVYPNLTRQSDYYDQLSVVSDTGTGNLLSNTLDLLQKAFTHK